MTRRDDLIARIHAAFPVGNPPRQRLTPHRCDECDEVHECLSMRDWPDVLDDFPQYCHDAWPLLSASAKEYYLPAWLIISLLDDGGMQGTSLVSSLSTNELAAGGFSKDQRACIAEWFEEYCHDSDGQAKRRALTIWSGTP